MNAEQLEKIKQLSIVNNRIGIIAKHILEEISGVPYEEPLEEINTATIENYKETSEINKIEGIQIYPHPVGSQSILQISAHRPTITQNVSFIIYLGKKC
ncbi:MAG: hypothetical protein IPO24_18540 [Bacteroidetes bacterium]|nr:hypothetical protein [Bacteroidota bacterium]